MSVNSFDEWSPLKEVIVGSPINYNANDIELSFKLFFHDNAYDALSCYYPSYEKGSQDDVLCVNPSVKLKSRIQKRYLEELFEDVEELVQTLKKLNVRVHRPKVLNKSIDFKTPYWKANCIPALNIRDQAIIIGNEIIETPPQIRARYFENDLLKSIFYTYFNAGSKWTVMPRPMMTDHSFDISYVKEQLRDVIATQKMYEQAVSEFDVGYEMMIDAAQCIRFGHDIIVNIANKNHELGVDWLDRYFEGKFKFHRIYGMTDNHIDSVILPLRPGLLLLRSSEFLKYLPAPLRKWDIIYPPLPTENNFPSYQESDLILTSKFIDLNVLSVDQDTVIVNALFPELMKTLEKQGITPIPVRHRHRRLFGGGFHCFTLDTVREGGIENYFD